MGREDRHSAAVFDLFKRNPVALAAFLSLLDIRSDGHLHQVSKASQWRYSEPFGQWWETDIYLLLEYDNARRQAVHIENKVTAGFTENQAENYYKRAKEWATRSGEEYATWSIVLIAPQAYLSKSLAQIDLFPNRISHETLAARVPGFPSVEPAQVAQHRVNVPSSQGKMARSQPPVTDEKFVRVFFAGAWETPTRIRTRPMGATGGRQIREFELSRFDAVKGRIDRTSGYWITMPASELTKRGITEDEIMQIEAADV